MGAKWDSEVRPVGNEVCRDEHASKYSNPDQVADLRFSNSVIMKWKVEKVPGELRTV